MDILGFVTLVGNILFNHAPVAPLAHGGDIVAITPQFTTPEFAFEFGMMFEKLSRGDAFVETNELADAVLGVKRDEEMDMVAVSTKAFEFNLVAFGQFVGDLFEGRHRGPSEKSLAIFDGKDNVVVSDIDTVVTSLNVHCDSSIA